MFPSAEAAGRTDYQALSERVGRDMLKCRIERQAGLWVRETHQGEGIFVLERFVPIDRLVWQGLRLTGLAGIGRRNFLDVQVVRNELTIEHLPRAFEGFRLLQITDLHCDLDPDLIDVVIKRLEGLEYDAVVITGDYHNKIADDFDVSLDLMARLLSHLRAPRFGILGNHDFIEKVAYLEAAGLPFLLNEAAVIERGGKQLWICGVDDPHYFRTEDLARARKDVPDGEPAILLSHSPEPYEEAETLGYQAMLCGHTHGGQICLPGGWPVIRNMRAPRRLLSGAWEQGNLSGYTSRGTGGCGVPVRFFCPPEMTVHILRGVSK